MTTRMKQEIVNANTRRKQMAKFRVQFDNTRQGVFIFEAEDANHAREIYEDLVNGQTYPDEIDGYEDTEVSNINYFELTDNSGKFIAE
jgi:hypothetical protein